MSAFRFATLVVIGIPFGMLSDLQRWLCARRVWGRPEGLLDGRSVILVDSRISRREFVTALCTTALGMFASGLGVMDAETAKDKAAAAAPIDDLYGIRRLSEETLVDTYVQALLDAVRFADKAWHEGSVDSDAGYWGDGVSIGNGGIRTAASMVLPCAALLRYESHRSRSDQISVLTKTKACLRYIVGTHVTGTQTCTDGKQWGATSDFGAESWQSGMWTGTFAFGAWLIWEKLDTTLQQQLERVIAYEATVLARRQPPTGLSSDTKAEENGWEVPCLVLASLMFPSDSRTALWQQGALTYMMNTLCTEADTRDTSIVDGKPVREWVRGANLYPDFTLENHNRFHPSYVACSCYFLTQAAMYYTYADRPIPEATTHHLVDTWRMFQTLLLPWGEVAYPQGMDWELHGLTYINLYASLATHNRDLLAANMEQRSLQYLRAWQAMGNGDLSPPGSKLGIVRHAVTAEQLAYSLLAHKVFGPSVEVSSVRQQIAPDNGVYEYPYVQLITHRTEHKLVSFSWKNSVMGLVIPMADHEGNPDLSVPILNGFVGSFDVSNRLGGTPVVLDHSWKRRPDGFETSGTLLLNEGSLRQHLKLVSVGSQTVVYMDRVTAVSNLTIERERGLPLGIENDEITGGKRILTCREGHLGVDWKSPSQPRQIVGSWANVDSRLGIVVVSGAGLEYVQASSYSSGISVYSDILYGSFSDRAHRFNAGEQVARRIAIVFSEVSPQEVSRLTQSCRLYGEPGKQVLQFQQPGGEIVELPIV